MPIDPRVEPEYPKTTQLSPVPDWAVELMKSSKEGFERMDRNLSLLSNETVKIRERVAIIEEWRSQADSRLSKQSIGTKSLSLNDMAHDAQLAQERLAREELSIKTASIAREVADLSTSNRMQLAILSRLDAITSNPVAKTLFAMVATSLMTWLASKGVAK